jgi:hypothetical protein
LLHLEALSSSGFIGAFLNATRTDRKTHAHIHKSHLPHHCSFIFLVNVAGLAESIKQAKYVDGVVELIGEYVFPLAVKDITMAKRNTVIVREVTTHFMLIFAHFQREYTTQVRPKKKGAIVSGCPGDGKVSL